MSHKDTTIPISRLDYDAFIFDLDGVVTKTAKVHEAAWKDMFDEYLSHRAQREGQDFQPFVNTDYLRYVDGKPRYEGVKSFLESRGITLPYGSPEDEPGKETICGLGNRKNELFHALLKKQGVETYPSTIDRIQMLRSKGFKTAIVSSSKNCSAVLEAAHIKDLFDAQVDGLDAERLGLKGKPDPDIFLEAADRLGVEPQRSVVAEDAISGVKAGSSGKFGLVIGVDRGEQEKALKNSGADVIIADLAEITISGNPSLHEAIADALPSAQESMEEISGRTSGKQIVLFLDYDGTLTPIVETPDQAVLSDSMRSAISELARYCTVAVVSGRDLRNVQELIAIDTIFYAGSHGFEIAGPKGKNVEYQQSTELLPTLDQAEQALKARVEGINGALVERKKFSVAVHYRKAKETEIKTVEKAVDEVLSQYEDLRKSEGKKVFDIQPDIDWDKGKAVTWLLETLDMSRSKVVPIYLGDDTTDEDAFRMLKDYGIGIIVGGGSRSTAARYQLPDTDAVQQFLKALIPLAKGETQ
ncbi:MAG: trehalose-phosphatase [Thermodesulfobacteriota bacterium]